MSALLQVLETLTFGEIVIFLIAIVFAVKEIIKLVDWIKGRIATTRNNIAQEVLDEEELQSNIEIRFQQDEDVISKISKTLDEHVLMLESLSDDLALMHQMARNDLKSWLTEQHHRYMKRGWIDDYSMDCVELRYTDYCELGGNSFIGELIRELRTLPHEPPQR